MEIPPGLDTKSNIGPKENLTTSATAVVSATPCVPPIARPVVLPAVSATPGSASSTISTAATVVPSNVSGISHAIIAPQSIPATTMPLSQNLSPAPPVPQVQRPTGVQSVASVPVRPPGQVPSNLLALAQGQHSSSVPPRIAGLHSQVQMFSRTGVPQPTQQFQRPLPQQSGISAYAGHIKPDHSQGGIGNLTRTDGQSKETIDEAENERTRLENRERKKRWREANEDRNKDNDLRCRVNKRAHKLFGKDPSKVKELWIEEEFNKRKSKRQEKEGKGPDGNLLTEGIELFSFNHWEINSYLMACFNEFTSHPSAGALGNNTDLVSMLQTLRTDPGSVEALFVGDSIAETYVDNSQDMQGVLNTAAGSNQHQPSSDDDEEEDENIFKQELPVTNGVDPPSFGEHLAMQGLQSSGREALGTALQTSDPPERSFSSISNGTEFQSQHRSCGLVSAFDPQVALTFSDQLLRFVYSQSTTRPRLANSGPVPATARPETERPPSNGNTSTIKQEGDMIEL